jgi:hypothetical protein
VNLNLNLGAELRLFVDQRAPKSKFDEKKQSPFLASLA